MRNRHITKRAIVKKKRTNSLPKIKIIDKGKSIIFYELSSVTGNYRIMARKRKGRPACQRVGR
jgi:hypothetical protein